MHEQDEVKQAQSERNRSAAGPHAFLQEPAIKHHEGSNEDQAENCQIQPETQNGEAAGRDEQDSHCTNQKRNRAKIG